MLIVLCKFAAVLKQVRSIATEVGKKLKLADKPGSVLSPFPGPRQSFL